MPHPGPRPLPLFLDMVRSETAGDPEALAQALAGLRTYQEAPRTAQRPERPVVATVGGACLRAIGGSGPPVVFVPSLINPPDVLDLSPGTSLLGWLAEERGFRTLLVDWGTPDPVERDRDVGDHVADLLLPLLATLGEPAVMVGYCLGGTMAIAAANLTKARGVGLVATPWHFAGFGAAAARDMLTLWRHAEPGCDTLGLVPMEVLQAGFWQLDPQRTVAKFRRLAGLDPAGEEAASFVALEDWTNAGAPLTYAAGRQLFEGFIAADDPGSGRWRVAGRVMSPEAIGCPAVEFVSLTDRIVPAATAIGLPDRLDLSAGHVGMVVGSGARGQLWEPLADWLSERVGPI